MRMYFELLKDATGGTYEQSVSAIIGGASSGSLSSGGFDSSDACTFLRAFKNVTATNSVTAMPMNTGNTCSKSTAIPLSPPSFLGLRKTAFIPAFALMPSGQWEVQNLSSGHGFMPLYEGVSAPDFRKRFDVRIAIRAGSNPR